MLRRTSCRPRARARPACGRRRAPSRAQCRARPPCRRRGTTPRRNGRSAPGARASRRSARASGGRGRRARTGAGPWRRLAVVQPVHDRRLLARDEAIGHADDLRRARPPAPPPPLRARRSRRASRSRRRCSSRGRRRAAAAASSPSSTRCGFRIIRILSFALAGSPSVPLATTTVRLPRETLRSFVAARETRAAAAGQTARFDDANHFIGAPRHGWKRAVAGEVLVEGRSVFTVEQASADRAWRLVLLEERAHATCGSRRLPFCRLDRRHASAADTVAMHAIATAMNQSEAASVPMPSP